jgi:uncharacterized protein (DUF1499 family)
MARRRFPDERTSRLAQWARRCAVFSLVTTLVAIVVLRTDMLEILPALAAVAAALMFSLIAIVLAFGAFVIIWRDGIGGAGHAFTAIAIGAMLLGYPAYLGVLAYRLPMINDITTDPLDPPRFDVLARLRPRGTVDYVGLYAAEQQRTAYPNIEPLIVNAMPRRAYEAAIAVMLRYKWRVVVDRPPEVAGRRDGQIEAVARTPIMGFRDDVAVRVRPDGDSVRIDVRSASRYGRHDLGTNAARIRSLLEDIDERLSARTEERRPAARPAPLRDQPASR